MTKSEMKANLNRELYDLGMHPNVKAVKEEDRTFRTIIQLFKTPDKKQLDFWANRFEGVSFILEFPANI